MSEHTKPLLSIVIPVYNESDGLDVLFGRLRPILDSVTHDWEIVCVNDGSRDNTLTCLLDWHHKDPRIKLLSLSRNFGKEAALTAGLDYAYGQAVIPLDADLQDPPELIPEMVALWQEGFKVVLATRRSRSGESWFKRVSARAFYALMKRTMSVSIPANTGDFRLMDQSVIQVLRLLPERARFMKGLFAWVGFTTATLYFDRPGRAVGTAKQNYKKLWALAKDGIFSFTTLPLRISTYIGLLISMVAFGYGSWLILRTFMYGVDVPGYASLMAAILFMGGIQLIAIGIVGEYIGRIYRETKRRPLYVVEDILGIHYDR